MGVHLDEVSLDQRRFREEDPAGGSDMLRQHLPPQQVQMTLLFVFACVRFDGLILQQKINMYK